MRGGLLVKEARLRAGLTQRALAERLGVTQAAIGRWESGAAAPTFDTVVRAIRACGLDLDIRLHPYDDSDDGMIAYHRAMSPDNRLATLENMLEFEALAREARVVDRSG